MIMCPLWRGKLLPAPVRCIWVGGSLKSNHRAALPASQLSIHPVNRVFLPSFSPYVMKRNQCIQYLPQSLFHSSNKYSSVFEDHDTKSLVLWKNLREIRKSPVAALTLGLSGLLPFIAAPFYLVSLGVYLPHIATAQVAYGASILSFLGGVRWGFTLPQENPIQPNWTNLGYSVAPSLVAWLGLLLPSPASLFTVMGGLVFAGYMDLAMYGYPPWFKGLRFTLTFVAVLSLWTTYMCSLLLKEEVKVKQKLNKIKI